jgi:hypothetical protein
MRALHCVQEKAGGINIAETKRARPDRRNRAALEGQADKRVCGQHSVNHLLRTANQTVEFASSLPHVRLQCVRSASL